MPRASNPNLSRGGGLAASKSVEASSFVHPTQGLDGLIAHITDPRAAHMAQTTAIVDAGGYFASDDVEGALQEIASSASSTGQNGLIEGGTYTAVGLTVTLATPTTARVNGTDRTLSGESVTLADNNTSWLYVNGSTGLLTSTTGAIPSITSPEHVLLARITTVAGAITASQDARWFVRNLDRKLSLTVRASGTAADRNSEASFESLDAALLYLSNFGTSGVMRTYTLVIKGALTVSAPVVIPVDNVTLQGDDGCTLFTGASVSPMIDISGRAGFRVRDVTFSAEHAASTAIGCPTGGAITDVVIERCSFASGASQWVTAIDFDYTGPQSRCVVRDCNVSAATYGVRFRESVGCKVVDTTITEAGSAGTVGIHIGRIGGAIGTTADSTIRGVRVTGFGTGGFLRGVRVRATDCAFIDSDTGIQIGPDSDDVVLAESSVLLNATTGVVAVSADGDNIRIAGCRLRNQRTSGTYTAEVPIGIDVVSGCDSAHIVGCQIDNFLNTTTPGGIGIRFAGTSAGSVVDACSISTVDTGITAVGSTSRLRITGCSVQDARMGLLLTGDTSVGDLRVTLDSTRGQMGIDITGGNVNISNSRIQNPRASGSYAGGDLVFGVRVSAASKILLSNVDISGFYNSTGSSGYFVLASGACSDIVVSGGVMETAWVGIAAAGGTNRLITGVVLENFQTGVSIAGSSNQITGCSLVASSTFGVEGVRTTGTDLAVTGCTLTNARAVYTGQIPIGIALTGENAKVSDCLLRGWRNAGGSLGAACSVLTGASQVTFDGNTVEDCWTGFVSDTGAAASDLLVIGNTFRDIDQNPIFMPNSDQVRIHGNTITGGGANTGIQTQNSVDVEITNNRIIGDATLPVGLQVSGTDLAANRCHRVVIMGNTITGCTTDGILLSGYVQNGVVSGNTVDNYLSATPFDPTANACIRIVSSPTTDLIKGIEVTGNICLRSRSGIVVSGVNATNLLESVTISNNTVHHCCYGQGAVVPAVGVDAIWTRNLRVTGNNIYRIGRGINDTDVEGDPAAGPESLSVGVRVQNSTVSCVSGNTIADLAYSGGSGSSAGIQFFNTSTVAAFDARDVVVSSNQLSTADGLTEMSSGIHVDSGGTAAATTILGLAIQDNVVRRVSGAGVLVSSSGNCSIQQATIAGNTVSQCNSALLGYGVALIAANGFAFTDGIIREVDIAHNTIGNTANDGIQAFVATGGILTGVSVRGNVVAESGNRGIVVGTSDSPVAFNTIAIDENMVIGPSNEGISIEISDFSATDLSVCNNVVTGVDGGAAAGRAISVTSTRNLVDINDVTRLSVCSNRTHSANVNGIYVNLDGALHGANFIGNVVNVNLSSECLQIQCDPVNTVLSETYMEDVTISGNTFMCFDNCVDVVLNRGVKLRNFTYVGNTHHIFGGASGLSLVVSNATVGSGQAVYGLTISSNSFDGTSSSAINLFLGDTITEIDACSNIAVTDNRFTNCNFAGVDDRVVYVRALGLVNNLKIVGNTFADCGDIEDDTTGNIDVRLGVNGPGDAGRNIIVSNNVFEGCSGCAVLIRDHAVAATCSLFNIQVERNEVYSQTNNAIALLFSDVTTAQGIAVSHNIIQSVGNAGLTSDTGILYAGPSATSTDQLSIVGNVVRGTGNNSVNGAIQVDIAEDINDLKIDGNTLYDLDALTAAIYVEVDGLWLNGSVSGNTVNLSAFDGIHLKATGVDAGTTGFRGIAISGNSINASGTDGIVTSSAVVASTPIFDNITITNNTVDTCRNGISISCHGLTSSVVSGNSVQDSVRHGIWVNVEDNSYGLSISNNVIYQWNTADAVGPYGGIRVELATVNTESAQSVSLSGNSVTSTHINCYGFWFVATPAITGMVIADNTTDMGNVAGTRSLYFEAGTGSQAGLNIVGNTLRRAVAGNGVNFTGSFAPSYSICTNNVERTGTGASSGNWGTGGAGTFTFPFTNSVVVNNQD